MITVKAAYDAFVEAQYAQNSEKTAKWYKVMLEDLSKRLWDIPINEVDPAAIRSEIADMKAAQTVWRGSRYVPGHVSQQTIKAYHRAARAFFNWCEREYGLERKDNAMRRVLVKQGVDYLPKGISLETFKRLWEATGSDEHGARDRAILLFLMDTGCRASELVTLTDENLMLDDGRAIVTGKGNKTRYVPFTTITAESLFEWLSVRPSRAKTVFCRLGAVDGLIGEALSVVGLREVVRRLAYTSGVTEKVSPHRFRHAAAREFLRNGGNLSSLQQLLGHSTPMVTLQHYARYWIGETARQQEQYGALSKVNLPKRKE